MDITFALSAIITGIAFANAVYATFERKTPWWTVAIYWFLVMGYWMWRCAQ